MERFVVERIRHVSRDPTILTATLKEVERQFREKKTSLGGEHRALVRELKRHNSALRRSRDPAETVQQTESIRVAEQRMTELEQQLVLLNRDSANHRDFESAFSSFDPVWATLSTGEQARIIQLLVECVDYDGEKGTMSITFRPNGIKMLAKQGEEAAA